MNASKAMQIRAAERSAHVAGALKSSDALVVEGRAALARGEFEAARDLGAKSQGIALRAGLTGDDGAALYDAATEALDADRRPNETIADFFARGGEIIAAAGAHRVGDETIPEHDGRGRPVYEGRAPDGAAVFYAAGPAATDDRDGNGYPLSPGRNAHLRQRARAHARKPLRALAREVRRSVASEFRDCLDIGGLLDAAREMGAGSYWLE